MTNQAMATKHGTGGIDEHSLRVDLAAAFRLAAHFDWHESVGNHFSAAVSEDGQQFLLNPKGSHFSTICASELIRLHAEDDSVLEKEKAPDSSAWCVHGSLHRTLPHARVILHCHPPYGTALCALKNPALLPIDGNTARFYGRLAIDLDYGGISDQRQEGARLAKKMDGHIAMMMGNHGVSVVGDTVAEAFELLYFLERASKTMVLAYSTGQPLNTMSPELAEKTARGWDAYRFMATDHFAHLKAMLDRTDPTYRD